MKFLFLFLSFYLLGLSCIPCSDSAECDVKAAVKISASKNHQEHNHSEEACTPFCACSCCATTAFYNSLNKVQDVKIFFRTQKHLFYNEDFNTEISCSIWQPPRIVA